jgi:predicted nucleotidyltransferase
VAAGTLLLVSEVRAHVVPKLLTQHRDEIRAAAKRCRGRRVRVFGSVARGDDTPDSDVDLLVAFEPGGSLFDLLHLTPELEALLGRSVDVVSVG